MRALLAVVVAVSCFGCLGRLQEAVKEQTLKNAMKRQPAWAAAAQRNQELGPAAYRRLVDQVAKRGADERVTLFYCFDTSKVNAVLLKELPPGKRPQDLEHEYFPSIGAVHHTIRDGFEEGFERAAPPSFNVHTTVGLGRCIPGPDWYESVMSMRHDADVYLWVGLELRPMPQCPGGRGYHLTAHWTSAYVRQDFGLELDFCRDTRQGGQAFAARVYPHLEQHVRPRIPTLAEAERLTPPIRYAWWLWKVENGGGGHGFGGD